MKRFLLLCGVGLFFFSCAKKNPVPIVEQIVENKATFSWYAFTPYSYEKIEKPLSSPYVPEKPWTQSVRISSISCARNVSFDAVPKGYAIVNRLGVLIFENDKIELCRDENLFKIGTSGNLFFFNDVPFFSIYKSNFFSDSNNSFRKDFHPFLIQFSPDLKVSVPVLTIENVGLKFPYEVTDFIFDGKILSCCAKTDKNEKNETEIIFTYFNILPKEDLTSITSYNAEKMISIIPLSFEKFREIQKPRSLKNAPENLKIIAQNIPQNMLFQVVCYDAGGNSPVVFENSSSVFDDDKVLHSTAILTPGWSALLFEDGTLFFKGFLYGGRLVNGRKTVALKLPRLPSGFVYSGFTISGETLYAAWEEKAFFNTARSGFIQVDLKSVLYMD